MTGLLVPRPCRPSLAPPCSLPGPPRAQASPADTHALLSVPELVEAINIQSTGPAEASRALRKKLKYGSVHGQKRALTVRRSGARAMWRGWR